MKLNDGEVRMKKKQRKRRRLIFLLVGVILLVFLIMQLLPKENKEESAPVNSNWEEDLRSTTNYVEEMTWEENGIEVKGIFPKDETGKLKICSTTKERCQEVETNHAKKNEFVGTFDLASLPNDYYELYIAEEKLTDTRPTVDRINRAHIKDKLVTMDYSNDRIKVKIEDFKYEYDILIDPGHGGDDIGSFNDYTDEKKLNLEQALYEKKRYEEHGLTVKLIREDQSYGIMMGDSSWTKARQRGYAMGYYGVVSRVSYSNHHNSSLAKSYSGWEIIVPGEYEDLTNEKKVSTLWKEHYKIRDSHLRFYARNDDGELFSRANDEIYHFTDYYAVIRIPYQLFHTKNTLYEGCYLSNTLDYDWYYNKGNWKTMSEDKIKTYVEYLGKTYIPPKS